MHSLHMVSTEWERLTPDKSPSKSLALYRTFLGEDGRSEVWNFVEGQADRYQLHVELIL